MVAANTNAAFPPCTAEECSVNAEEREAAAVAIASKPTCEMTERCVSACAAYGKVCPCAARIASHAACDSIRELQNESQLFPPGKPQFFYLNADDIVIGEKLGVGGFSNVNQCIVTTGEEAGQEFAVKYLKRTAMVDLHQFKHGASDLAVEAHFLHALNHPHIVKLHGVTAGSVESNVASGKECGFFIVVDRLYDTLEARIDQWRAESEASHNHAGILLMSRWTAEYKEKKRAELSERVRIAYAIADAMEYLHQNHIVYRDLKPDNIGFDKDCVLKIFDFGLAKELKPGLARDDGRYQLTGNTGSRRYMAPEVAKECPYDQSVDVYSFGILLWELCSAEKPFYGYSSGKHLQQVVFGGERPKMDHQHTAHWPMNLQWLMKRCWSAQPSDRPSFTAIKEVLRDVLECKDSLPETVLQAQISDGTFGTSQIALPEEGTVSPPPPPGGFGLFRASRGSGRHKSVTASIPSPSPSSPLTPPPPKDGFGSIKKAERSASGGGRAKSWGFVVGLRR